MKREEREYAKICYTMYMQGYSVADIAAYTGLTCGRVHINITGEMRRKEKKK